MSVTAHWCVTSSSVRNSCRARLRSGTALGETDHGVENRSSFNLGLINNKRIGSSKAHPTLMLCDVHFESSADATAMSPRCARCDDSYRAVVTFAALRFRCQARKARTPRPVTYSGQSREREWSCPLMALLRH